MISINEVKQLLKREAISDAEAEAIRDACYELAAIMIEYLRTKNFECATTELRAYPQWCRTCTREKS